MRQTDRPTESPIENFHVPSKEQNSMAIVNNLPIGAEGDFAESGMDGGKPW